MTSRPSLDYVLMLMTRDLSQRGTCSRSQVGCLIAKDGRVLSSGYNGAPAGMPHCVHPDDEPRSAGCTVSVHAEANAIAFAARHGTSTAGATLYTTLTPCVACAQLIIQANVWRVFADAAYRDPAGWDLLKRAGLTLFTTNPSQVG